MMEAVESTNSTDFEKTIQNKAKFLIAYKSKVGNVSEACKVVGIDRTTYYVWLKKDEVFKKACEEVRESLS